jgi:hypothetical protein
MAAALRLTSMVFTLTCPRDVPVWARVGVCLAAAGCGADASDTDLGCGAMVLSAIDGGSSVDDDGHGSAKSLRDMSGASGMCRGRVTVRGGVEVGIIGEGGLVGGILGAESSATPLCCSAASVCRFDAVSGIMCALQWQLHSGVTLKRHVVRPSTPSHRRGSSPSRLALRAM